MSDEVRTPPVKVIDKGIFFLYMVIFLYFRFKYLRRLVSIIIYVCLIE
jgi:hypothetical protein